MRIFITSTQFDQEKNLNFVVMTYEGGGKNQLVQVIGATKSHRARRLTGP
jgi:hypothetical protein